MIIIRAAKKRVPSMMTKQLGARVLDGDFGFKC